MKLLRIINYKLFLLPILFLTVIAGFLVITKNSSVSEQSYTVKIVSSDKLEQEDIPFQLAEKMRGNVHEMKNKGFITVPEVEIPNLQKLKEHVKSLIEIEKNTSFTIKKPKWLPENTTFVGGVPGGPNEAGPWNSIELLYNTPKGKFLVDQARPENGGAVYQQELIKFNIQGQPAQVVTLKGEKSGLYWNSISWSANNTEFVVEGTLPIATLKKIAESLE